MIPPVSSVTLPLMPPEVIWADRGAANRATPKKKIAIWILRIGLAPLIKSFSFVRYSGLSSHDGLQKPEDPIPIALVLGAEIG